MKRFEIITEFTASNVTQHTAVNWLHEPQHDLHRDRVPGERGGDPFNCWTRWSQYLCPPNILWPRTWLHPNSNWRFYVCSWFSSILPAVLCSVFTPMRWLSRTYPRFSDNSPQERRQINLQIDKSFHWEINVTLIYASSFLYIASRNYRWTDEKDQSKTF